MSRESADLILRDDLGRPEYAKSNGNGPLHLLASGSEQPRALCGRTRVHPFSPFGASTTPTCPICQSRLNGSLRRAKPKGTADAMNATSPGLTEDERALIADLLSAYQAHEKLRAEVRKLVIRLRMEDSHRLNSTFAAVHSTGITLEELGRWTGMTRERVRQRIAAGDSGPMPVLDFDGRSKLRDLFVERDPRNERYKTPRFRAFLLELHLAGISVRELADALEVERETVHAHLTRARKEAQA